MPKPQLIRPEILPDEIAQSYANRLVLVNGGETLEELMDRLSEFTTPQKNVPKVVFLAWAAGLELDEFVRLHTLTPFQRAFAVPGRCHAHGANLENHLRHETLRIKVAEFRQCCACSAEDEGYWGFTFLRVSHHVPGVDWCEKHGVKLTPIGVTTALLESQVGGTHLPTNPVDAAPAKHKNPLLERYAEIVKDLMGRTHPISTIVIARLLQHHIKSIGLRIAKTGKRDLISDFALKKAPLDWLKHELRSVFNKQEPDGSYLYSFDTVTKSNGTRTSEAYVLALALCFDNSADAMRALIAAENESSETTGTKVTCDDIHTKDTLLPTITVDELAANYAAAKFNITATARKLGRSCIRIRELLKKYRFPPQSLIRPAENQRALQQFLEGKSHSDACIENNVSARDFDKLLRTDFYRITNYLAHTNA